MVILTFPNEINDAERGKRRGELVRIMAIMFIVLMSLFGRFLLAFLKNK